MVRKDGDTMKECMKANNPTGFRSKADLFEEAMDAYKRSENYYEMERYIIGADFSREPDGTIEQKAVIKVENKPNNSILWHAAKVVNTTYNLNVRAEPSLESAIVGHIHPDSEFSISAIRTPDWYKVRLKDGTEGFASSKYVARVDAR